MKTTIFFIAVLLGSSLFTIHAQTFTTGFDTPAARSAWTEYRLGGTASTHWGFNTAFSVSPTYSIDHDYPMGGDTVADWFVSPKLVFTGNSGLVSLYSRVSALSGPPAVYYGVWISFGSRDPHAGDYAELSDLTLFPSAQGTWSDTALLANFTGDTGYIAIKYKADNYAWLMLWIDDVSVDSAMLAPVAGIEDQQGIENITIYPNPSHGTIYVSGEKITRIELLDLTGQIIFREFTDKEKMILDFSRQNKGIYILRIEKSGGVSTQKIILI